MRHNFELKTPQIIFGLILFILLFTSLYFVAISIFRILAWLSPALLIAALILDYKTVLNYGKWLIEMFKTKLPYGIFLLLLTVLGYPLVAGYLFFRALLTFQYKKNGKSSHPNNTIEYIDYEEIEEDKEQQKSYKNIRSGNNQ